MKGNVFKPFSIFYESNCNSNILLTNCGFSPDFFNKLDQNIFLLLEKNNIKKIKSENDIISLRINEEKVPLKKAYEAEDKETYKKKLDMINKNKVYSGCYLSSYTTMPSQDNLNKNNSEIIKKNNNNNYIVKAYKSKLKKKYNHLYEINSIDLENKNKAKLYHKCCYPGCNRTFSSSGWLKAHLKYHLKQIHNSKYCKLFESYILNKNAEKMGKKNNLFFIQNKSVNNLSNSSKNDNVSLLYSEINLPKPPNILFDNDNNANLNVDNSLYLNSFINPLYTINYH
jgi:hypothetical protein